VVVALAARTKGQFFDHRHFRWHQAALSLRTVDKGAYRLGSGVLNSCA
jgi:hypothetical protein